MSKPNFKRMFYFSIAAILGCFRGVGLCDNSGLLIRSLDKKSKTRATKKQKKLHSEYCGQPDGTLAIINHKIAA